MKEIIYKNEKKIFIILFVFFVMCPFFISPAFARFKNRSVPISNVWSGNVATSYRNGNGTSDKPYVISNSEELAFFSMQLENTDYEGVYFKITNHLRLNDGIFKYDGDMKYILGNNTYYIDSTNNYYDNANFEGEPIGSINMFPSLENFKGTLDGASHVIYGLYLVDDNTGLFENLSGNITDLYISNAMVKGNNSGILANRIEDGMINNVMVEGYVISDVYNGSGDVLSIINTGNYTVSGGIAAYTVDSILTNCVNKVQIIGSFLSGGLVGYLDDSSITNAYSTSNASSYSANTIGVITGTSSLSHIYSTGGINGGLIGYIISATCNITDSFITTDNDLVISVTSSTINADNNYYTYAGRGNNLTSTLVSINNLKDETYLTNYHEFVDFDDLEIHSSNIWVFDDDIFPVLYIDDIINPYVELNLGVYMWNSYSSILETKKFNDNISFVISDVDNVHNYDKYYYVSNSQQPLSKSALESVSWTSYSNLVQISNEGFYVVYVKIVNGNEVSYINSDILVIDKSEPDIDILIEGEHYTSLMETTIYFVDSFTISVSAVDVLSGIKSIEYYIGNDFLSDYDVEWTTYQNTIQINTPGEHILYVKVTDGCDFVSYASSPLIVYDGYTSTMNPLGFDTGDTITSNSSMVYTFSYANNRELALTHQFIASEILPRYTKMTLIDNINGRVYGYMINSNGDFGYEENGYATYPFNLFTEIGIDDNITLREEDISNEEWKIILDFSNTNINADYDDLEFYLEGYLNGELVRPTINHETFDIASNRNSRLAHSISTNYNGSITYNSDSVNVVNISNIVSYANGINDTSYFNKKIGLSIKLVDSLGRIMSKDYLKNFTFAIGNEVYIPSLDNIIHINLNTNESVNTALTITTHQCTPRLRDGTYYIKINAYASLDGLFYDSVIDNGIMIPVVVMKTVNNSDYGFDVLIDPDSRIINKAAEVPLSFTIRQSGLDHPNIKVSMYVKDELTAYNQDYSLIDLGDYSDIVQDVFIPSVYYVSRNPLEEITYSFNLDTTELEKTSYKFVFDLYDGNLKVSSVSKNIIIR